MSNQFDFSQILAALAEPFPSEEVEFKPGALNSDKTKALALAYVDSRPYIQRLNLVCPDWQDEYLITLLPDRVAVLCRLTVNGITRTGDGECLLSAGEKAEENAVTTASAQAFKRACVKFGLGAYLYALPQVWCDYDHAKRKITNPPQLPRWAVPASEQEAREAVMTFILGLVAEPIPMKFVHQPNADRAHEVAGLKVLEKYNCVSCHILKPGSYQVRLQDEARGGTVQDQLLRLYRDAEAELRVDPGFPESTAWCSNLPYPPDRVIIRGLPRAKDEENNLLSLEPWEAIHFRKPDTGETLQLPVKSVVTIPLESKEPRHPPYGGLYTDIHTRVIAKLESKNLVGDRPELMGSAPPPLMREGQKVQPRWLLEFLQRPIPLRPSVYRHLRMPQFNLSPDEAQVLVNYFIAVDRLQNPAVGANYSAARIPQQSPAEIDRLRKEYRAKLRQFTDLSEEEIGRADYFEAGWQLLTNRQLCLQCHNSGNWKADGELVGRGPSFHLAPERLQPDYMHRWISVPPRLIPYTKMNWFTQFYRNPDYPALQATLKKAPTRVGVQLTPVFAAVATRVAGPTFPMPVPEGMYHRLQMEFALTPDEKVRAARDAILTWGSLPDPPPTAVKAGPRPDAYTGDKP
jgi:hypothetical protein